MRKLSGKNALITGGNSGIGLATAKLFREHGAHIMITGRNSESLEQSGLELGGDTVTLQSDAGSLGDIERLMQQVEKRFGVLDILFVNAASGNPAPFALTTEEQFDEIAAVCFKGVFFTVQKALPFLAYGASVIITTSITNSAGAPNFSVYAACKAAQRSLVQTIGLELIERGVRVNAISPGPVNTPGFGRWDVPKEIIQAARTELTRKSPVKRFGEPEEIAAVALFLASNESSYLVGAEIVADGGISLVL